MSMSRRRTIMLIVGGVVLAAASGAGAFVSTRTPARALEPWSRAGGYGDPRLDALSWALLAPNPHNLQPWLAELVGADALLIHRDPTRTLPQTDPHGRQLTIGMGCFLELMRMAAAQGGRRLETTLFPDGPGGPVAHVRFMAEGATPDPLFGHAAARRSCKKPFDMRRPVPREAAEALAAHGRVITDDATVDALRSLTWEAWMTEVTTSRTHRESVDLMRFGRAEIDANPDGIALGGPMLEALMLAGILTRASQLDPNSSGFRQGVAIYRDMLAATQAYVVQTTAANTPRDHVEAGRRWLRLNLATTSLGLALHPVSQCLQEYPEMSSHYRRVHELVAAPGETVQMLGRLGYGPAVPPTPRWRLESRIRHG